MTVDDFLKIGAKINRCRRRIEQCNLICTRMCAHDDPAYYTPTRRATLAALNRQRSRHEIELIAASQDFRGAL